VIIIYGSTLKLCDNMLEKELYYQRNSPLNVPLRSQFIEALHQTSHGNVVEVKKYRPHSVNTVFRHTQKPIAPQPHVYGKQTKASILGNLKRSQSAQNILTCDSWLPEDKKLCQIRYYYKLDGNHLNKRVKIKDGFLEKMKTKETVKERKPKNEITAKSSYDLLAIRGTELPRTFRSAAVNTLTTHCSLKQWHGAEWQRNLPKMYKSKEGSKYEVYNSKSVRWKSAPARFRDTSEMV